MPDFTAEAFIMPRRFTADAVIIGERWRHHRTRDHFGIESDLYVVLSENVGPYVAYTPVHWVLADLLERLAYLEDAERTRDSFSADAYIAASGTYGKGVIFANAALKRTQSGSFTANAWFARGGSFTADAFIRRVLTADAYIVR